eukprot:scaffold1916_cov140-Amphora_coffeaeformis.AAC.1
MDVSFRRKHRLSSSDASNTSCKPGMTVRLRIICPVHFAKGEAPWWKHLVLYQQHHVRSSSVTLIFRGVIYQRPGKTKF